MKKGFTLIELLIVIAVLVTLMGMVFKLSGAGGENSRRVETIARLQKLENCLSGYFAAFGSYPPVRLHGSRSIYQPVSSHGIQKTGGGGTSLPNDEWEAWQQVRAACLSQPIACNFPYPASFDDHIREISDGIKEMISQAAYDDLSEEQKQTLSAGFHSAEPDTFGSNRNDSDWRNVQIFRYGVMSYLLPRFLVMLRGDDVFYENGRFAQWSGLNELPCDPFTGNRFSDWQEVKRLAESTDKSDLAKLANIPSQAACARWMPNLEGICSCSYSLPLFGVDISSGEAMKVRIDSPGSIELFSPHGSESDSVSDQYVLDSVTVCDGWGNDFYYYSPPPYQNYKLWSSGPDGKTFPPWIARDRIQDTRVRELARRWSQDDISTLSE